MIKLLKEQQHQKLFKYMYKLGIFFLVCVFGLFSECGGKKRHRVGFPFFSFCIQTENVNLVISIALTGGTFIFPNLFQSEYRMVSYTDLVRACDFVFHHK